MRALNYRRRRGKRQVFKFRKNKEFKILPHRKCQSNLQLPSFVRKHNFEHYKCHEVVQPMIQLGSTGQNAQHIHAGVPCNGVQSSRL